MDAVQNDLSDVAKLDQHFTDRRAQELALEAETQRAQHVVQMGGVRNERIRKAGIAALLGGAGIGLACFGASFLIAPNTRVVTVTKEVPGPERVVTVTKEVPGPERVVTVTKEVPGPERVVTVTKEVPGPERVVTVTKEVPGPERVVTVTKEVPGPERVVTKEVPGPERVVTKEVPGPERVIHDAPVTEAPVPAVSPVAPNNPSPYAPKTPDEQKFTDKPAYKDAAYHGRIVKSRDGRELSFEDGNDFHPGHWDNVAGHGVTDEDLVIDSDPYVGDLGMCVEDKDHKHMWDCTAMHNGQVIYIPYKTPQPPAKSIGGTPPATEMVGINVDLATSWQIRAMVDTGCSWPMSLPSSVASAMLDRGLATRAGSSVSTHADGSEHDVDVILIKRITVEGRVLHDVEASVAPSQIAPVLLGLGALNRLGSYTITDGRLVFTSEQPT